MKFRKKNRTRRRNALKRRLTRKKGGGHVFKRNGEPIKVDLVIARYKEKLDWVKEYLPKEFHKIHVYNKGPQNITCDDIAPKKSCKVYDMSDKNVGVCDHTYLYHIIENWDNLADVTIFCPGSIYLPYKTDKFNKTLKKVEETGNTAFFVSNQPHESRMTVKENFVNFTLNDHLVANVSNRNNAGRIPIAPASIRPFGAWYEHHLPNMKVYGFSLWGIFAASKEDIKKQSKSFYENIIKDVSRNKHEEASHFMERAWTSIIHSPDHQYKPDGTVYRDVLQEGGNQNKGVSTNKNVGGGFELVVARYTEDIRWLETLPKGLFSKIRVYNKGKPLSSAIAGVEIIQLENIGRESHTYLTHVVNNYSNLAKLTVFVPGSVMKKDYKVKQFHRILDKVRETGESMIIVPVRTREEIEKEREFKLTEYKSSNNDNRKQNPNIRINISESGTLGSWYNEYFPGEEIKCISWYAIFAATRQDIHKRPVDFYKKILATVSSSHPEEGHYLERLWSNVFSIGTCEAHERSSEYFHKD